MSAALDQLTATMLGLRRGRRQPTGTSRPFARFVLDATALAALDAPPAAADTPYSASPTASGRYPQSLVLTGRVRADASPAARRLRCRPLLPGRMLFLGDPGASRPQPDQVSRAAFTSWDTRGTILVDLHDAAGTQFVDNDVADRVRALTARLPGAMPTRMWYGTVRIPAAFLFDALPLLAPAEVPPGQGGQLTQPHRERISAFLRGEWGPVLRVARRSPRAADDHVAADWMPELVVGADGRFEITISAARVVTPFDGPPADLDAAAPPGAGPMHPAHPRNGAIPARLVYQVISRSGGLADPLPAALQRERLGYRLIQFTRTWRPGTDCSVHFPTQAVKLQRPDGTLVVDQRLAAHGLLFHGMPPQTDAAAARFTVSLVSIAAVGSEELRWVDGSQARCWQQPGKREPVAVDLAAQRAPHIAVRRPMATLMMAPPYPDPLGPRCTYLSMRRSVRALVDNRIAGGRLAFEANERWPPFAANATTPGTRAMIDAAFADYARFFARARSEIADELGRRRDQVQLCDVVADGRPAPDAVPGRAGWLLPVLIAFFPGFVPVVEIDGSRSRDKRLRRGHVAYLVWQSRRREFAEGGLKRNFPDDVIGRGGPGALVVTGLASRYFLDPPPSTQDPPTPAYFNDIVARITDGTLEPGSLLQFWPTLARFNLVKSRQPPTGVLTGHSPVFAGLLPAEPAIPQQVEIIDQNRGGRRPLNITEAAGQRRIGGYEIWIAAEWSE